MILFPILNYLSKNKLSCFKWGATILKTAKIFLVLLFAITLIACLSEKDEKGEKHQSKNWGRGPFKKARGFVRTANRMGYMDTVTNNLLQKYLNFAPHAPGHLMDLGCAWGYATEQILALEEKDPFLKLKKRKLFAVDVSQKHVDYVAKHTSPEIVEAIRTQFPNQDSKKAKEAFSPNSLGATYAGLIFPYLNGTELTQGLKLLYQATAPSGRIYLSVDTPSAFPSIAQVFLRRKKSKDLHPGWFPNLDYGSHIPERIRKQLPDSIHVFDLETVYNYVEGAGFRVLDYFRFTRQKGGGGQGMETIGLVAEKKKE